MTASGARGDILWNQPYDGFSGGVISRQTTDASLLSAYLFDDISVEGGGWTVSTVTIPGIATGSSPVTSAVRLAFTSEPNFGSITSTYSGKMSGNDLVFSNLNVALSPGKHWMSAWVERSSTVDGFYWAKTTATANGSQFHFHNPGGGFGLGTQPLTGLQIGTTVHDLSFTIEGNARPQAAPVKVYLAFGTDVPWDYAGERLPFSDSRPRVTGGSMRADTSLLSLTERSTVAERVERLFHDAGATNVEVIVLHDTSPPADVGTGTIVYFTDKQVQDGFRGDADPRLSVFTKIDGQNKLPGEAVLFTKIIDAETGGDRGSRASFVNNIVKAVAHEVGHTFGLLHVDSSGAGAVEVMDESLPDDAPIIGFNGTPAQSTDRSIFFGSMTQNSQYHLRRFVAGESVESIEAAGLSPGTWDLTKTEMLLAQITLLDPIQSIGVLKRLRVLVLGDGLGVPSIRTLYEFGNLSLAELNGLRFYVPEGSEFAIVGDIDASNDFFMSSSPLPTGDNLFVSGVTGNVTGYFYQDTGAGATQVATFHASITVTPEPASCILSVIGTGGAIAYLRLRKHRRSC